MNEASGTKTFNVFSEYRKSSKDAALKDLAMDFGSDTERSGGYVEFFGFMIDYVQRYSNREEERLCIHRSR